VIGEDEFGSIEYAVAHLHTPLLMVLGHESCGAVTAALMADEERRKEWEGIQKLLTHIDPALQDIDPGLPQEERIRKGVEANVHWSIKQLESIPEISDKITEGKLKIVGAVYELDSGKVRILARV